MLEGFGHVLTATEQEAVASSGAESSQLIEGNTFSTSLGDSSAGTSGEAKSAHLHLGDLSQTRIVGNSANNDSNGLLVLAIHVADNAVDANRGTVSTAHEKTLEDNGVEFSISSTS